MSASTAPALWAPELTACTVILDEAPVGFDDSLTIDLQSTGDLLADQSLSDGRHVVLADTDGHHRIWLRQTQPGHPLTFLIPPDDKFTLRTAVAQRLYRRLRGLSAGPLPTGCAPTGFQRNRLSLLLALLDTKHAHVRRRDMAAALIFRGMAPLRGAEWKGSNERRRTYRLIDEAVALMSGAYRRLLSCH